MNSKEKVIKLLKALIFCILLICIVSYTDDILERKTAIKDTGAFFNEKEGVEVLFLGTSHVMDAVYPMELWNDYGITSHNFGGENNTIALDYWMLKNALVYSKPKVVVLDCSAWEKYDVKVYSVDLMHKQVDAFPLNRSKIDMLNDLLDNWNDRLQFIWNFSLYHNRWSELTDDDFQSKASLVDELNRGSMLMPKVAVPASYPKVDKNDKLEQNTIGAEYLRKIIEECQSEDIDILLTYLPFPAPEMRQMEANTIYDVASEYNINYVNFLDLDVVNYVTDFHDANSHVNAAGGRKITDYLGEYITTNYDVTDHRQDPDYTSWNENYNDYMEYKISELKKQQELDRYFTMLTDKNLSCCVYMNERVGSSCDERMKELIANIAQYGDLKKLDTAIASGKDYFLLVDNGKAEIFESTNGESIDISNTTFGHVAFGTDGEDSRYLYIQDGESNYIDEDYDVIVTVINKYTGSIEDVAQFSIYDKLHYGIKAEN